MARNRRGRNCSSCSVLHAPRPTPHAPRATLGLTCSRAHVLCSSEWPMPATARRKSSSMMSPPPPLSSHLQSRASPLLLLSPSPVTFLFPSSPSASFPPLPPPLCSRLRLGGCWRVCVRWPQLTRSSQLADRLPQEPYIPREGITCLIHSSPPPLARSFSHSCSFSYLLFRYFLYPKIVSKMTRATVRTPKKMPTASGEEVLLV